MEEIQTEFNQIESHFRLICWPFVQFVTKHDYMEGSFDFLKNLIIHKV